MASDASAPATIIIIKKKGGHGGHHGGAWKVAYADFVTAMMALFIVLWLLSASVEVKKAVGGYFQDPAGVGREIGSGMAGSGDSMSIKLQDMNKIKEKLQEAVKQMVQLQKVKDQVQMSVTGEGLRIELLETDKGMFFQSGKPEPSAVGKELLTTLAKELGTLPNRLLIEGHTDAKPFSSSTGYSNWDLSSDRANNARRIMESTGVRPGQVMQVRGFADQDLRDPKKPDAASNRRISVIVRYNENLADADEGKGGAGKSEEGKKKADGAKGAPGRSDTAKPGEAKPVANKPDAPKTEAPKPSPLGAKASH